MLQRNGILARLILVGALAVSVLVTPWISYDPINVSRILGLSVFGFGISLMLGFLESRTLFLKYRVISIILFAFFLWVLVISFLSPLGWNETLFGVSGRQTGLIAYFMFVVFMLGAIRVSGENFVSGLLRFLFISGLLSGIYGLIQWLGKDPFDWINPYSPVFGFFGNPNFHSSFMGISGAAALVLLFGKKNVTSRGLLAAYQLLVVFNIFQSKSQQGFFVYAVGIFAVTILWMRSKSSKSALGATVFALIGGLLSVLDIFQRSPWSSIFYEESVSYRGDFWRAGWQMTLNNPIFGLGLDGYRDSFRIYRDEVATNRNAEAMVDSAHNVFFDISSGGGFPLLILYLAINIFIFRSALRVIRRNKSFNPIFAGLVGSWLAYSAQSLISINQIGLAIWGWVLGGAIIGYEINIMEKKEILEKKKQFEGTIFGIGALIGLVVTLPLFIADAGFRSVVAKGDVTKIVGSVQSWPQSPIRMNLAASILRRGGFPDQALEISKSAVEKFPRNFEAWQELLQNDKLSGTERISVISKMRELDPLNPNIPSG
jgi:O-antigen ligase